MKTSRKRRVNAKLNSAKTSRKSRNTREVNHALGCWKWFSSVLKEAGVTVTPKNRAMIDEVIHEHIGEHAQYEKCSASWVASGKKVKLDKKERKKLIEALKAAIA
jgi:hypothetical protein